MECNNCFIPIPVIPGLIRNFNNSIYQIIKIINKAKEYNSIKNDIIDKLKEEGVEVDSIENLANQSINQTVEQAQTVMEQTNKLQQNLTKTKTGGYKKNYIKKLN